MKKKGNGNAKAVTKRWISRAKDVGRDRSPKVADKGGHGPKGKMVRKEDVA